MAPSTTAAGQDHSKGTIKLSAGRMEDFPIADQASLSESVIMQSITAGLYEAITR